MPEFSITVGDNRNAWNALDAFTRAYIEAVFFTESGDDEGKIGDATFSDLDADTLAQMVADCTKFQKDVGEMIAEDIEGAGRDFWYTRNGHGAGFWDGDWPEFGDELTKAAERFGMADIYLGDDGKVYEL